MRFTRPFLFASSIAAVSCLFATPARATITVNSIDESRVSAYEGLSAGSTGITIYGGIAGTCANANANSTTNTCSSCLNTGATGDSGLLPCNDRRINPNLVLSLTVTSTDHDGYPAIAVGGTTTTGGQAVGTIIRDSSTTSTTLVPKTSPATINIPWRSICAAMTTASSTGTGTAGATPTGCDLTASGADYAQATFNVGVIANASETTTTSADDLGSVTIVLRKGEAAASSTASTNGITYFEMYSGDNKGTIGALQSAANSGFPVYSNIRFRWIRILFEQRNDSTKNSPSGGVWNKINPGSPHVDLEIQAAATDVNNLNLSPIIIQSGTAYDSAGTATSVSIANDHVYDTKVAVVDEARNVAFYTPAAKDNDCEKSDGTVNNNARSPATGLLECHTLRPAVVVGVLSNKVNCFIATASYGSPMAGEVDTFRHFRDQYLIPSKLGLKFVRWYYNEGPKYAQFIRQNDTYRAIARAMLWLPLQFAKLSLEYGLFAGLTFLLASFLMPIGLIALFIRKVRRGPTHA